MKFQGKKTQKLKNLRTMDLGMQKPLNKLFIQAYFANSRFGSSYGCSLTKYACINKFNHCKVSQLVW